MPRVPQDTPTRAKIRSPTRSGAIDPIPFATDTAEEVSLIRATTRLKAADAIHAARQCRPMGISS